jgi:hypothetical protein
VAKVEWHLGELYLRVGFIVTNLERQPSALSPYTTSAARRSNGSRKARAQSNGLGFMPYLRRQRCPSALMQAKQRVSAPRRSQRASQPPAVDAVRGFPLHKKPEGAILTAQPLEARECRVIRQRRDRRPGFGRYHEALNRARWARDVARRLLFHLLAVLSPSGEVVIGVDDTIDRRWGAKIRARGIYRDAVRSSHGHFVKTSGLRWLSLAVMLPIPFAGQRWALPFLTVLAPSARWSEAQGKRHKALTDWAKQAILQTKRWLPDRRVPRFMHERFGFFRWVTIRYAASHVL